MMNSRSAVKPLPMSVEEISARGWDQVDVVFVSGDGYVDWDDGLRLMVFVSRSLRSRTGNRAMPGENSVGRGSVLR